MNARVEWNISYEDEIIRRIGRLKKIQADDKLRKALRLYYSTEPADFINDWCITIDPRNVGKGKPVLMPFILYPKQRDFINWLHGNVFKERKNVLVDKCRDMGATWLCCAYSVWLITFHKEVAIGWGSRKEDLVDKIGDPKGIFHKIRGIIKNLPYEFRPKVRDIKMLIENLENGSTIAGEVGNNIGRGGRTTLYFKDESAFYENPATIEASLGLNTEIQVDISTHNGTNTVFYRKTQTYPKERIFELDWWDSPTHDDEWLEQKRHFYEDEIAMPHLFEQEIMRNPAGSIPGVVIPAKHVRAAVDAHLKLGYEISGLKRIALDVADEGGDKNAICERHGILVKDMKAWKVGTTTETAGAVMAECEMRKIRNLRYDSIGVGAGIKGECKRLNGIRKKKEMFEIRAEGWNAGSEVVDKHHEFEDGKTNGDMFLNAKAQAWWMLRERFRKTYEAIEMDEVHDPEDLISLSSDIEDLQQVCNELSQPQYSHNDNGKIKIDKKPKGSSSPNLADAIVIAFAPEGGYVVTKKTVGGMY